MKEDLSFKNPDGADFWNLKVAALLHDPPFKPWIVPKHAEYAANSLPNELKELRVGTSSVGALVEGHHEGLTGSEVEALRFADYNSSSVERPIADLVERLGKQVGKVTFIHPLSGLELNGELSLTRDLGGFNELAQRLKGHLAGYLSMLKPREGVEGAKTVYLMVWRGLEHLWRKCAQEHLGGRARWLIPPPADTRMPTHTVFEHLESTSMLAPCCTGQPKGVLEASLVSFDVGGVQPFISRARKTGDLWSGSWLVSLLSWSSLREVCELIGPDAVVFPYLKGAPFVDAWIAGKAAGGDVGLFKKLYKLWWEEGANGYNDLLLSLIPPTSVILSPNHLVGEVRQRLTRGVKEAWRQICDIVWSRLESLPGLKPYTDDNVRRRWERQVKEPPIGPVRIVHTEFPRTSDELMDFLTKNEEFIPRKLYELLRSLLDTLFNQYKGKRIGYPPRPSIVYSAVFSVNSAKIASLRHGFEVEAEPSPLEELDRAEIKERCSICGLKNPLFLRKEAWKELNKHKRGVIEWDEAEDQGEYLCSVCLIKRLLHFDEEVFKGVLSRVVGLPEPLGKEVMEEYLGGKGGVAKGYLGFPSTSDFAAANFKHTLIRLIEGKHLSVDELKKLDKLAEGLINVINRLELYEAYMVNQPPAITKEINRLKEKRETSGLTNLLWLLGLCGEYLDPDTYDRYLIRVGETPQRRELVKKAKELVEEVVKVVKDAVKGLKGAGLKGDRLQLRPWAVGVGDTFAVLKLDGDYMGGWLLGDRLPTFAASIPSEVREEFKKEYATLADKVRPLSPAAHVEISRALIHYARFIARSVVEQNLGVLVYSGGDDALALLPPEGALSVAQRLSEEFSREWDNRLGYVALGMGHRASCSVGLVFVHYMHHLAAAVERALELAEGAKESTPELELLKEAPKVGRGFANGKGALKAEFYGRAGPITLMSTSLHWFEPWDPENPDSLRRFVGLRKEGDVAWVGVSWINARNDVLSRLLCAEPEREFFSPPILAEQLGALTRGGLGDLRGVEISRRLLYEVEEGVTRLGGVELEPLMAVVRKALIRHIRLRGVRVKEVELAGSIHDRLKQLGARLEKCREGVKRRLGVKLKGRGVIEGIKSLIDGSMIAERAYEHALCEPERFKVGLT